METRTRRRKSSASRLVSHSAGNQTMKETTKQFDGSSDTELSITPSRIPLSRLTIAADTPLQTRGLQQLRQKIEDELTKESSSLASLENVSPGLARLRNTPGRGLKERQRELIQKHEQIRQNSDKLSVGGGIALWPNMNQMRLTRKEIVLLIVTCIVLMAVMGWFFVFLHGKTYDRMWRLGEHLTTFRMSHPIQITATPMQLKTSIIGWHTDFTKLLDGVDMSLNVTRPSSGYQLYIGAYLIAVSILLYFLLDNMLSKSKLSPGRIKKWVCLLVVVGQWTIMLCVLFVYAHKVEAAIINNVYWISEKLGELVERDLDSSTLTSVIQYWRWRCLPPAAPGVIQILGLVPIQDAAIYLQYYSLPVLTVLLTPVVRLCLALRTVYISTG